ncbi:hypothetical protein GOV12_08230 [Candidatus Pacearchaeota archaeon]|nr:hypothetical protein [Candidatus Pacearchaeota archaeon]
MMHKRNKKGMIFTLVAIVILSIFLLTFVVVSFGNDRKSINKRIETMNNYVYSLEEDLPRQLYISGFRIIFIFERSIVNTGIPINNFNDSFEELFYNGTLYGASESLMNGVTYSSIMDNLFQKASSVNLITNLTNPRVFVTQDDPWNVKVVLNVDIIIQDVGNLAYWNKTWEIVSYIPIENFEDPMYVLNTGGLVTNRINKTSYIPFVNGTDTTNLRLHNENFNYIASTDAPSFLNRLKGEFDANLYGIESLVYLTDLSAQGIPVYDKSCVDHVYFSTNNSNSNNIQNMPGWFKIDDGHLNMYNVSGLVV